MEELKKLNKYLLSYHQPLTYFRDVLDNVNLMSTLTLKLIENQPGSFFTLLPSNANLEKLYQLKPGGILPQFPEQEIIIDGCRSTFCWIPDIYKELAKLILDILLSDSYITCVIDDFSSSKPSNKNILSYIDYYTMVFEKEEEIYYILTDKNASHELLLKYLNFSNTFWHSLAALTAVNVDVNDRTLSLEKIEDICANIQVAFVGAYDGEGYLFWEKQGANGGKGFFPDLPMFDYNTPTKKFS